MPPGAGQNRPEPVKIVCHCAVDKFCLPIRRELESSLHFALAVDVCASDKVWVLCLHALKIPMFVVYAL